MLKGWLDAQSRWGEFVEPEDARYCWNLPGPLKILLPIAAAIAAPELIGALAPAAAAGGAAAGAGADIAGDAGLAATLNAAPDFAGAVTGATEAAAPLAATAPALAGATSAAVSGLPDAISGLPAGAGAFAPGLAATSAPILGPDVTTPAISPAGGASSPIPGATLPGATTPTASAAATPVTGGAALPGAGASAAGTAAPASVATASSDPQFFLGTLTDTGSSAGTSGTDLAASLNNAGSVAGGVTGTDFSTPLTASQLSAVPGGTTDLSTLGPGSTVGGVGSAGAETAAGGSTPGNVGTFLKDSAPFLGPAVSLLGLGYDYLKSKQPLPGQPQISSAAAGLGSEAAGLTTQGQQLASYLQSGTLPPGVQNSLNTAGDQAKESVRSMYASRGMAGSSAEAEDLASVDQTVATQGTQIATNLLQTGINEQEGGVNATGLSAQLYQQILNTALQRDTALGSAIGNFAQSLVPRTNLTVPATA